EREVWASLLNLADVFMQPHRSVRAQLGGSVHLECHMKVSSQYSYIWIKHTQGELPETIVFWSYHEGRTHKANDGKVSILLMRSKHYLKSLIKAMCIFLCKGKETIRGIFQPPVLKPVQYGDDVTLEYAHQVFWIHRTIRGSYQTIRSTHENKRTCESQECVYSLQKKNFSFQDMGTYYCALVTCGEVILGNGTEFTANSILYTLNLLIKQTPGSCIVFVFGKFRKYIKVSKKSIDEQTLQVPEHFDHSTHIKSVQSTPKCSYM
uniref:Ig-like domain-containing protein n=1 Tax=Erpetoichthys calabaricus TaxID=27687 RepID=A0A8C4SPP8_ERPCA